ncbi:MAG: hypothetical protein ABSA93_27180 [Streptosporangiaceae bacterium]
MVPENLHDFFVASASVAGALIGLLFVAISVSSERLSKEESVSQAHRIRARAALISFLNALSVSLFGLLPGEKIGYTATSVAAVGLVFVLATVLSLIRLRQIRWSTIRELTFLGGLVFVFVLQLIEGWMVIDNSADTSSIDTIAFLVVVCFLIGVSRSWELIGGPDIAIRREVTQLVRHQDEHGATRTSADDPGATDHL